MSLAAIRCEACGGSLAFPAGASSPTCPFCGAADVVPTEVEQVEPPEGLLPFLVDEAQAQSLFRTFATASIWYPGDVRSGRARLTPLYVPAWTWSARVETHWAALIPAATASGREPRGGLERRELRGVLIPASQALTTAELRGLSPFEGGEVRPLSEARLPYEAGTLTRTAAQRAGQAGLADVHAEDLRRRTGATTLRTAVLFDAIVGRPLLLPIWIAAYRSGDQSYRIVINGQNGRLVGKAPYSPWRIALAVLSALTLLGGLACGGLLVALLLAPAGR